MYYFSPFVVIYWFWHNDCIIHTTMSIWFGTLSWFYDLFSSWITSCYYATLCKIFHADSWFLYSYVIMSCYLLLLSQASRCHLIWFFFHGRVLSFYNEQSLFACGVVLICSCFLEFSFKVLGFFYWCRGMLQSYVAIYTALQSISLWSSILKWLLLCYKYL